MKKLNYYKKYKKHYSHSTYGYVTQTCPICNAKTFDYVSYAEECYGIVEQHGYCHRCGYLLFQAYSPVSECFVDIKKGYKNFFGEYIPKNVKRHKRIRKKLNINKNDFEINPIWATYV